MIDELYSFQREKKNLEIKTFNSILSECVAQIKFENNHGRIETEFKIPAFVLGFPIYDYDSCVTYIYDSLLEKGLRCTKKKDSVYITWKIDDNEISTKPKNRLDRIKIQNSGYDSDDLRIMGSLIKKKSKK